MMLAGGKVIRHGILEHGALGQLLDVEYLLRATFNRANIALAAGDLETQAPGSVQDGAVTLVVNDGPADIVDNKLKFGEQITPVVGDLGGYGPTGITRALGRGLLATLNLTDFVTNAGVLMWVDSADVDYNSGAGVRHGLFWNSTSAFFLMASNAGALQIATSTTWVASTDYRFAIVIGGNDSARLPYYVGQTKSNYPYGFWLIVKGGVYTSWTVLWVDTRTNTTPMYAAVSNHSGVFTVDNFRVPDVDLSSAQVPVAFSSFTGSNGTSLDAITPEVGPAWVEANGDWDIQSNRANSTGTAPAQPLWTAYVASGISAFLARVVVNVIANRGGGHLVRRTDGNNQWWVLIDNTNNTVKIWERNAGVTTERASTSVTINASTDYDVVAIVDGTTITGFVNNASRVTYGSATLNQTATQHGTRTNDAGVRFDNYTLYARRSNAYNILDTV